MPVLTVPIDAQGPSVRGCNVTRVARIYLYWLDTEGFVQLAVQNTGMTRMTPGGLRAAVDWPINLKPSMFVMGTLLRNGFKRCFVVEPGHTHSAVVLHHRPLAGQAWFPPPPILHM